MEYHFELTGQMPILFHADNVEENDKLREWRSDPKNSAMSQPGDDRTPPWTWQTYLYNNEEHLTVPAEVIMKNLCYAGAKVPVPGKGKLTFKSMSQTGLFIAEEHCKFTTGGKQIKKADWLAIEHLTFKEQSEAVKDLGFLLFVKRAKIGTSKHIRVRARFQTWQVSGTIAVVESAITEKVLGEMFLIGGKYGGLLDWRPNSPKSPGPFGTYVAKLTSLTAKSR